MKGVNMKKIIATTLASVGVAGLCVEGGIELVPLQAGAIVCLAIALAMSGVFDKEQYV
jgi:drug/metabolite transporter (DMT)-like permease